MYFTYVLLSVKDKRTYSGFTKDINVRLKQHNAGQVKATKHRRPFVILFSERFKTKQEAKKRELWWKSGVGRRKLKEYFDKKKNFLQ